MKGVFCILLVTLALGAVAGPAKPYHSDSKELPPKVVSPPTPVDESDRTKVCPEGFNFAGKQCLKIVTAMPDVFCGPGTVRVDDQCAKYTGKLSECPVGYSAEYGVCKRQQQTDAEIQCPQDFVLSADGKKCFRQVQLAPTYFCPAGSVQKGDNCVAETVEAPQLVCPPGYVLEGKRCRTEETYDCTPPRVESKGSHYLRKLGPYKKATVSSGKEIHPTKEEYVLQKTCKRIKTEAARKICVNGRLAGKECIVEVAVAQETKPGAFSEEQAPANLVCPPGFSLHGGATGYSGYASHSHKTAICVAEEEVAPNVRCPHGTIDVGNKCATFRPINLTCPQGFNLENGVCVNNVYAPPIVEYTVTYKCTGKNCADEQHQHQQHQHYQQQSHHGHHY